VLSPQRLAAAASTPETTSTSCLPPSRRGGGKRLAYVGEPLTWACGETNQLDNAVRRSVGPRTRVGNSQIQSTGIPAPDLARGLRERCSGRCPQQVGGRGHARRPSRRPLPVGDLHFVSLRHHRVVGWPHARCGQAKNQSRAYVPTEIRTRLRGRRPAGHRYISAQAGRPADQARLGGVCLPPGYPFGNPDPCRIGRSRYAETPLGYA